jgi:hypothetical protein
MICVHARHSELEKMGASALSHLVIAQMGRIERLELLVAKLRREHFGPKSEKAPINAEPAASGPMFATTALPAITPRPRCGSPTRRTARANTRNAIWLSSQASCKPTHSPDLTSFTRAERFSKHRSRWDLGG